MGFDTLHLGWHHLQVTLWDGTGRDLVPGNRVRLHAGRQDLSCYDVDVAVARVAVRDGVLTGEVAAEEYAPVCLTGWGEPAETAGRVDLLAQHEAEVASTAQLFAALGIDDDPRAVTVTGDESESPQRCPHCARIRAVQ